MLSVIKRILLINNSSGFYEGLVMSVCVKTFNSACHAKYLFKISLWMRRISRNILLSNRNSELLFRSNLVQIDVFYSMSANFDDDIKTIKIRGIS